MRRLLIVSPHFSPVNAPDMQRVRLMLPHLRALGWEATVLAVHPDWVEGAVVEPLLEKTYPADTHVVRVQGIRPALTRRLGFGSLWWRCGAALRRSGDALLAGGGFDLVFFSTTQFDAFTLGPRWLKRFGVPFVIDYQDPWVNDYYRIKHVRPPGGSLKFWLSQFTARRREPSVLRATSGIISVSEAYGPALHARYPWFEAARAITLPFGATPTDIEVALRNPPSPALVPFGDDRVHHVYTGRCGADMRVALTVLFRAFARFMTTHPREADRHRFHFIGTDYAPPPLGRETVMPVAVEAGVGEFVSEHCGRVPYFEALNYLARADALILVGSDDASYSASKAYPYLLTRRPLLTISHEQSPMCRLAREQGHAATYGFTGGADVDALAGRVYQEWFVEGGYRTAFGRGLPARFEAGAVTARLVAVFESALSPRTSVK